MIILSIETSCDETAVSIVEAVGDFPHATYKILGNALFSQVDIHREYGGVFPEVAKREHAKTLVPMLEQTLCEAELLKTHEITLSPEQTSALHEILEREPGLCEALIAFLQTHKFPHLDLIAVTSGPGLAPALWVGINFARALSYILDVSVVPVNHMEGHILSSIFTTQAIPHITFPAISLLISGGHTELVLMNEWMQFEKIGQTRDDAVGEAFDKVARMLGLPYPGGPEISMRARRARMDNLPTFATLPRPMLDSGDLAFSFSGLKTAVRYAIQDKTLTEDERDAIARDFENTVAEVLLKKTIHAVEEYGGKTVIVGGGVSANTYIREIFTTFFKKEYPDLTLYFPPHNLSTDNSIMIALCGHARTKNAHDPRSLSDLKADGNLSL